MASVVANPMYNDQSIGQGFSNLAQMFAPPDGREMAGYADASLTRQKQAFGDLLMKAAQDPNFNQSTFDREGQAAGVWSPSQGYYAINQDAATKQRGQDVSAASDLSKAKLTDLASMYGPLSQGQVRPAVPEAIATQFGAPGEIAQASGAPKPLTADEERAIWMQNGASSGRISPAMQDATALGNVDTVNIVGPDGKPQVSTAAGAIGQQPAYPPNKETITQQQGYGDPDKGYVWARNPDGTVKLDPSSGAPVEAPISGGPQAAAADKRSAANNAADLQHDVVMDSVDQALDQIAANPNMTTGLGAQLTGAIGSTPAKNLAAVLNTIKGNITIDKLNEMRANSPTGGALGSVTEGEERMLAGTLGPIDQMTSAPQLYQALQRFKQVYYDTINGPGAYEKAQAARSGVPTPKPGDVVDGFVFKGGDPSQQQNWQPAGGN